MSAYAEPEDMPRFGIKAQALAPIDRATQLAALSASSAIADSYFRQRYGSGLPFQRWDDDIRTHVCWHAAHQLLCVRGFNPLAGADMNSEKRSDAAMAWFRDVARQMATPNVVLADAAARPAYDAPRIMTRPLRGW